MFTFSLAIKELLNLSWLTTCLSTFLQSAKKEGKKIACPKQPDRVSCQVLM